MFQFNLDAESDSQVPSTAREEMKNIFTFRES